MHQQESISEKIVNAVEDQRDDIPAKDYRFYQVDKLIRMVKILEKEKECAHCRANLEKFDPLLSDLMAVMDEKEKRIELEKLNDDTIKHLRKVHQYYLPRYFNYTYSFVGMAVGLFAGTTLAYVRDYPSKLIIIFAGWFLGLVTGRLIGSLKDRKIKNNDKQI